MCLLAFAWRCDQRYDFVFVGNRDEFYDRPTAPAAWWPLADGRPGVIAGRDLEAGGTWLGLRADGAFATVTNVRERNARRNGARSRGRLVTGFLLEDESEIPADPDFYDEVPEGPLGFLKRVSALGHEYAHFNLVTGHLAEPASLAYVNNVEGSVSAIGSGIHVLSNHRLDTPWPKATRSRAGLGRLLEEDGLAEDALIEGLLALFADREPAAPPGLPDTGIDRELERALSAPFIVTPGYGTRATTVILCRRGGETTFVEQSFNQDGEPTDRVQVRFTLSAANAPPPTR